MDATGLVGLIGLALAVAIIGYCIGDGIRTWRTERHRPTVNYFPPPLVGPTVPVTDDGTPCPMHDSPSCYCVARPPEYSQIRIVEPDHTEPRYHIDLDHPVIITDWEMVRGDDAVDLTRDAVGIVECVATSPSPGPPPRARVRFAVPNGEVDDAGLPRVVSRDIWIATSALARADQ